MSSHEMSIKPYPLSQAISPFIMPPPEYNTMIPQGLTAQLARSQAARRSGNKSGTPGTSRRGSARISKSSSIGYSPHSIQRRRTTAAHHAHDAVAGQSVVGREIRSTSRFRSQPSSTRHRPYSWHPGPQLAFTSQSTQLPFDTAAGSTIEAFQNLAVTNTPPMVEQPMQNALAAGHGFLTELSHPQLVPESFTEATGLQSETPAYAYASDTWSQRLYGYPYTLSPSYSELQQPAIIANTAVYPPAQNLGLVDSEAHIAQSLVSHGDSGEELVGIGLYDDTPEKQPSSRFSPLHSMALRETPTKDLKLEETWQPPTNLENEEESSDDGDDAQEPPNLSPDIEDAQPAFYPANLDLSNQSFFFSEDNDPYVDDQYMNFLAFNTGLTRADLRKVQDPSPQCYTFF